MKKNDWKEPLKLLGQKLGKFKYPIAILLLGLILVAIPVRSETTKTERSKSAERTAETPSEPDELRAMEEKLEKLLSQIDGAGSVKVMLRYAAGSRIVYQTDSSQEVSTDSEGKKTQTDIQTVMASGSGGQDSPVVVQTVCPTFQGALIIAQGAESASVKLDLVNAVSSLTGLGADKITVIKMKSE